MSSSNEKIAGNEIPQIFHRRNRRVEKKDEIKKLKILVSDMSYDNN